jgi:hypothetical protein
MTQVNLNISLRPTPELVTLAKYLCEALKGISMSDVADDKPALEIIEDEKQQQKAVDKTKAADSELAAQVEEDVKQTKKELEAGQMPTLEEIREFLVNADKSISEKAKELLKEYGKNKVPDLSNKERADFYNKLKKEL